MQSRQEVCGINVGIEWREVQPGIWKINHLVKAESVEPQKYPESLQKAIASVTATLKAWFQGTIPRLPLDVLDTEGVTMTETKRKILDALYEVPRGSVISYRELGEKAGLGPVAGRPVGNAMATNPWGLFYPCHRVIKSDYSLGNYGMGTATKAKILEMEGVTIRDGICKNG
jgi:methylated-DNA-[protein]-cysteine S-methyltransferase